MIETYVSIGKVTDYAIGVLKYFATASSILLISIIGALTAWIFWSAVGMIVAIVGIVIATIVLPLGIYELQYPKETETLTTSLLFRQNNSSFYEKLKL